MRGVPTIGAAGAAVIAVAISATPPLAHTTSVVATVEEITVALRGKTCTTRAGPTFTFAPDGRYAYDGLWKNGGQYAIGDGVVTVTLDSGLERSYAVSRHGNVLYLEETPLYCRAPEPVRS